MNVTEAGFTEPRPPGLPGLRMPMMPPGSQAPTTVGPGQPQMFPRGMRPPFDLRPPGVSSHKFEPRYEKTSKMMCARKTQISLGIHQV